MKQGLEYQVQESFLNGLLGLFALGILTASLLSLSVEILEILAFVAFLLSVAMLFKNCGYTWVGFCLLFLFLGAMRFQMAYQLPVSDISNFEGKTVMVTGRVREEPVIKEKPDGTSSVRYIVDTEKVKVQGQEKSVTGGISLYTFASKMEEVPTIRIGDKITASGKLRVPIRYNNPGQIDTVMLLRCQGITAQLSAGKQGVHAESVEGYGFLRKISEIRAYYLKSMEQVMPKEDAAAIFAMLFGGYAGIKEELVEAFTTTGIVHILSVSGSHISLLAATMAWLCGLFRLPLSVTSFMVIGSIAIYSVLAGCVPPVIRSAIMGGLTFMALAMGREKDARRILTLTGLGMLFVSPLLLFHISFQLSFSATAGLLYLGPMLREKLEALPELIKGGLSITLAAQLSTLPFLAWYFNQVSISSLLSNITVVPIVELMIMLGLFGGIVGLIIPVLAKLVFVFDSLLLGVVYEMTRWMAKLPGSLVYMPTMSFGWSGIYYGLLVFLVQERSRQEALLQYIKERDRLIEVGACAIVLFFAGWQLTRSPEMAVHFIDVHQGNSALVVTPHGHGVMIDTGGVRENAFDIGTRVDMPYLLHYGIRSLDYILLTHAHEDHAAGAGSLLRRMPVGNVITAHEPLSDYAGSMGFQLNAPELKKLVQGKEGTHIELDGVSIDVIYAPAEAPKGVSSTGNELSNVYRITYGKASFLFTGDMIKEQEKILLEQGTELKSTVLQVGHHGSHTSSSEAFVQAVKPAWAVFSVGADNTFGHPRPEIVKRYQDAGSQICRTDHDGAVVFYTDGEHMRVEKYVKSD